MTEHDFHKAIDLLTPSPDLERRVAAAVQARRRPRPLLVRPALAAAAALLVMCTMGTALAASPELRQAVLSFFHLEEPEQVPPLTPAQSDAPNGPDVAQGDIGGQVKAQYIRLDGRYQLQCGLFTQVEWDETYTAIRSARFYELRDGQLAEVDVELHTATFETAWRGADYYGTLYWFIWDGKLGVYAGETRSFNGEIETGWYVSDIPGRTDAVLLRLSQGRQIDYGEYPFLWHLDTGEVEDFLSGTGAEALERAYDYTWSEDLQQAVILCSSGLDDLHAYLCDRTAGTVAPLEELTGMEVQAASFGDGDTLILYSLAWDDERGYQTVACYAYDTSSGQLRQTLPQTPYCREWEDHPNGVMTFGDRCVRISEEGQTWVVDLNTGMETLVDQFTFTQGSNFMPSPNGNRLLYFHTATPEAGGLGITQLGAMDLEQGVFLAFDREGCEAFYEESINWYDDNRAVISARTVEDATRYLILYEF